MLKILDSITAELLVGLNLVGNPRWMLDGSLVVIGPYHSQEEHELHLARTVGSTDWLWSASDELRFDQKTLRLASAMLRIPDATLPADLSFASWRTISQEVGLLQLVEAKNFQLQPTKFRWFDEEANALVCVSGRAIEVTSKMLRLHIAEQFELFFIDGLLAGWALLDPERFIVDAWEEPSSEEEDDASLTELLKEYLALITDPYIEQMEDDNPELLDKLLDLYGRTTSVQRPSRKMDLLRAAIADKLDRFYGREVG